MLSCLSRSQIIKTTNLETTAVCNAPWSDQTQLSQRSRNELATTSRNECRNRSDHRAEIPLGEVGLDPLRNKPSIEPTCAGMTLYRIDCTTSQCVAIPHHVLVLYRRYNRASSGTSPTDELGVRWSRLIRHGVPTPKQLRRH